MNEDVGAVLEVIFGEADGFEVAGEDKLAEQFDDLDGFCAVGEEGCRDVADRIGGAIAIEEVADDRAEVVGSGCRHNNSLSLGRLGSVVGGED